MDIKNWTRKTFKGFYQITEVAAWIGYIATVFVILIVFVDVFGRYLLNAPLLGSVELVELSMVVLAGITIMYAAAKQGHVAVIVITRHFSQRTKAIMQRIISFLGFGASFALAYQFYQLALYHLEPPQLTENLRIGTSAFTFILAVAIFLCSLTFLIQTFHPVASEETTEGKE